MKELDVRNLACPGPVIELNKLLEAGERKVILKVADDLARSNVTRFAARSGAKAESEENPEGGYVVTITAGDSAIETGTAGDPASAHHVSGPQVVQVTSTTMGKGNDELGSLLLRSFIKTCLQSELKPDTMLFYNSGIKLCCTGSPVLDDLRDLEEGGVEILACGTCLNFFEMADSLSVGRVTDMLEIVTRLSNAGRTVRP